MVTAAATDQWRLLDVQAHDLRLAQLAHRRDHLPELEQLRALAGQEREVTDQLVAATTTVTDLQRDLNKAEADVAQVRQRAARDQARLDSGQGSAKDLQALQHEVASLAERQTVLEDAELEVMERLEEATSAQAAVQTRLDEIQAQVQQTQSSRDAALAEIADLEAKERRERDSAAGGIPADLLRLYDRIRENNAGIGAAKLYQRRCEGCRLELNSTELGRLRNAADDAVVRCEECGRILVRTADSGL